MGFRVQGLGFRVWGLGFRVSGFGFRVQGPLRPQTKPKKGFVPPGPSAQPPRQPFGVHRRAAPRNTEEFRFRVEGVRV